MEFNSVDPAALIIAIIALLLTVEQLARSSENILDNDFKIAIAHICVTSHQNKGYDHYKKLNENKYYRLLIENGFSPLEMCMNGNHPAQGLIWKKIWSGIFISIVAKLLRKRLATFAFIFAILGYFVTLPLRLWFYFLFKYTKPTTDNRTILKWTSYNNHCSGYNGQQFDKFIKIWISQLGWTPNNEMEKIVTWVAYLATWTGNSKIIGPTCSVRILLGEEITIGDIIFDASLYMNSIKIFYMDKTIRGRFINNHESFNIILNPPNFSKNNYRILRLIRQWELIFGINKLWWLEYDRKFSYNLIECNKCKSNNKNCTIGLLPLIIDDINDIDEYERFNLNIIDKLKLNFYF